MVQAPGHRVRGWDALAYQRAPAHSGWEHAAVVATRTEISCPMAPRAGVD